MTTGVAWTIGLVALSLTAAAPLEPALESSVFISPSGEPLRPGPATPRPFEAWFARADTDHDGRISRAEFRADAEAFFRRLDANADDRIDGFEIAAYERDVAPELEAATERGIHQPGHADGVRGAGRDSHGGLDRRRGRPGAKGGGPGAAYVSLLDEPEPVSGADLDVDSRVSAAEWLQTADRRFDRLDAARAGFLAHDALLALLRGPPKPRRGG